MKKWFLILMLVFGLVSAVQADYARFELASGSTVAAGHVVTVNLVSDLPCWGWNIDGVAEVDGSGNQAILPYGGIVSNVQLNPGCESLFSDAGYIDNYQGSLFSINFGGFTGSLPANQVIMSFDYTINGLWDGSAIRIEPLAFGKTYTFAPVNGTDEVAFTVADSTADIGQLGDQIIQGITIVPEPITIALLGVGGLFLRRKK